MHNIQHAMMNVVVEFSESTCRPRSGFTLDPEAFRRAWASAFMEVVASAVVGEWSRLPGVDDTSVDCAAVSLESSEDGCFRASYSILMDFPAGVELSRFLGDAFRNFKIPGYDTDAMDSRIFGTSLPD